MNETTERHDPVAVDRPPRDGRCFVCGRTPEEIDAVIDVPGLRTGIASALGKQGRPASDFDPAGFKPAGTRFELATKTVPYDFRGRTLRTSRSFPAYELRYHQEGSDEPVDPAGVVLVTYQLPVCPFCSQLLDDASKAAYKTIHAQDFCEDD
ncbi:MAG: hypothetical protein JW839_12595 [Candidatus Lokiarchaeota archaeon]|nr:hypothetical protein [Candidatus Lokiarchaeota archaeon]